MSDLIEFRRNPFMYGVGVPIVNYQFYISMFSCTLSNFRRIYTLFPQETVSMFKARPLAALAILRLAAIAGITPLVMLATPASAQLIDPSNIHVGPGAGVMCDTGCAGEPNPVGSGSTFDLYQTSGGKSLADPTLLILAVPNDPTGSSHGMQLNSGSVTGVQYYGSYIPFGQSGSPGTPTNANVMFQFGSTKDGVNVPNGFAGDLTSGNDVYDFLGIGKSVTNSDSFANFTCTGGNPCTNVPSVDLTAMNFGIYVFQLDTGLGSQELINIDAMLPVGTYILGYGLDNMGQPDSTPFTEAGVTGGDVPPNVPEPGSLALLGGALAAMGFMRRGRRV